MTVVSHKRIVDACNILFGPEVIVSMDFLRYLQPSRVKAAYRKKAIETHPDRAKILGIDEAQLLQAFKDVNDAYEQLYPIVGIGNNTIPRSRRAERQQRQRYTQYADGQRAQKNWGDGLYSGRIPQMELLMGRFMYYSGLISWNTLIDALAWQRRQHPLIGQLAVSEGLLTMKGIQAILFQKKHNEKFGQCAIRSGYLKHFYIMRLLNKQRDCNRLFGHYFTDKKMLKSVEVEWVVKQQRRHNETIKH